MNEVVSKIHFVDPGHKALWPRSDVDNYDVVHNSQISFCKARGGRSHFRNFVRHDHEIRDKRSTHDCRIKQCSKNKHVRRSHNAFQLGCLIATSTDLRICLNQILIM
jgi:hypothetical protein